MCFSLIRRSRLRLCYSIQFTLLLGVLSQPSYAEQALSFVPAHATCANIFPFRKQWKKYPPSLPDPQKIPLFISNEGGLETEWKRLYLPRRELTQQEVTNLDSNHLKTTPDSTLAEPGLLVNNQPWIDFLRECPNRISSNRQLNPSRGADWVAPHFFELYELPLKQSVQKIVATRFRDHGPYYGGDYLALYPANNCSAEKLFVSSGSKQQLEFLHRNGSLLVSVKSPSRGSQSYFTVTDNGNFLEVCRSILTR